ncbi:hypothetical protein N8000_02570 [Rhodospirillales bacterium]|nr:hypothetical protein [Rhodospirillales bacterium]
MTNTKTSPFNLDELVETIKVARREEDPVTRIKFIMDEAFKEPAAILAGMPSFEKDETTLFEDDRISIWNCRFNPGTPIPPHDHQMSAIIGIYAGIERNCFYKLQTPDKLSSSGHTDMEPGRVLKIAPTAIHSVECISEEPSCGIHVYFGPLTKIDRSLFDLKTETRMKFTDEAFERLTTSSDLAS